MPTPLLTNLFGSTELPEDFAAKVETIFEATVVEKVDTEVAAKVEKLQESYDAKLAAEKEAFITEALATIDAVTEEAVLEWAKENAVGLDTEVKGQLAESFLVGLKGLFVKADIELTNEGAAAKQIAELNESLEAAKKEAADAKAALTESTDKLTAIKRAEIIAEATKELPDTVAHRAKRLCEAFEFKSAEDFSAKVGMIVEAVTVTKVEEGKKIEGTMNADGTVIAVDTADGTKQVQADTASGASPAPEVVTTVHTKPEIDKKKGAEGLKEAFDAAKQSAAPHFGEDLVALTLKLMK